MLNPRAMTFKIGQMAVYPAHGVVEVVGLDTKQIGGAVLFDDACDEAVFHTHSESVGKLLNEIVAQQSFRLVKSVNRLAHIERVR